jgi:hypothetical protein
LASTKPRLTKRQSKQPPPPPEPPKVELRVVTLQGIEYFVMWEQFQLGCSFFLPTAATQKQAEAVLAPVAKELGIRVAVRNRCEYGRYGVRVWRVQ